MGALGHSVGVAWGTRGHSLGSLGALGRSVVHGSVIMKRSIMARCIYTTYLCNGYLSSDTLTLFTSINLSLCLEPTAVQNLAVESRTTNSLLTTWDAPFRCVATEYVVKLKDVPGSEGVISATETRHTFTGLTAGTLYTVVVVTASGHQRSTPTEGQFYISRSYSCQCGNLVKPNRILVNNCVLFCSNYISLYLQYLN